MMTTTTFLFLMFIVLILVSATPLLGLFELRWSLPLMIGLFGVFFVMGWGVFLFLPFFNF